jgi:hypothetical protein
MTTEHRHFSRIPFDANATIVGTDRSWETDLLDISLKGVLVSAPDDWSAKTGDRFFLKVSLDAETGINMEVEVAHQESSHIGFHCHHIDVESIGHLRRIVELNLGDENLLHRELSALGEGL